MNYKVTNRIEWGHVLQGSSRVEWGHIHHGMGPPFDLRVGVNCTYSLMDGSMNFKKVEPFNYLDSATVNGAIQPTGVMGPYILQ